MYPDDFKNNYDNSQSIVQNTLFGANNDCETGFCKEEKHTSGIGGFSFVHKIFLSLLCIASVFLLVMPFIPEFLFQSREVLGLPHDQRVEMDVEYVSDKGEYERDIEGDTLVIPSIGVNVDIVEGEDDSVLSEGVWRRPNTSTPNEGGNMVITGHRFHYIPPNNKTFYNLDKLEEGRKVYVYWGKEKYAYVVYDTFLVDDTRVDIEGDMEGNILTLYTCHPLWTADERLVVRAELVD